MDDDDHDYDEDEGQCWYLGVTTGGEISSDLYRA